MERTVRSNARSSIWKQMFRHRSGLLGNVELAQIPNFHRPNTC